MDPKIDLILARYFGGTSSENDLLLMDAWLLESVEHQRLFVEYSVLYGKTGGSDLAPEPDLNAERRRFEAYLESNRRPKMVSFFKQHFLVQTAAIVLLLIVMGGFLWLGQVETVKSVATHAYAQTVTLPDGTVVALEEWSLLRYGSRFGRSHREVHLEGAARFVIAASDAPSFRVLLDEVIVEDIGTTFRLADYAHQEEIRLEVEEGMIQMQPLTGAAVTIEAGEVFVYNKSTGQLREIVREPELKEPEVIEIHRSYYAASLNEIAADLQSEYQMNISFDAARLGHRRLRMHLDGVSPDEVMERMGGALGLSWRKTEKGFELYE